MISKSSGNEVHLPIWSEIVGTYNGLYVTNCNLQVRINNRVLSFPKDSEEAGYVQEILEPQTIGKKTGILRTDLPGKPLRIRLTN